MKKSFYLFAVFVFVFTSATWQIASEELNDLRERQEVSSEQEFSEKAS